MGSHFDGILCPDETGDLYEGDGADDVKEQYKQEENITHGSRAFPIGLHKTIIPSNSSVGESARYQVLYTHWHSEFELFFLLRGECIFVIDGREYNVSSGEAVFVPANAIHSAYRLSPAEETVFYAAVFSRYLLCNSTDIINEKYIAPILSGQRMINTVFCRRIPWQAEVLDLLEEIISLYDYSAYDSDPSSDRHPELLLRADAVCPELTIKSNLLRIWSACISYAGHGEEGKGIDRTNHERVRHAIEYMHEHYWEPIRLEDISSYLFVSREYFSRIFKKYTNVTPFSYLTNYRISRSIELLDQTDLKIIEIAERCGFAQVSYFNRKFSEIVKCSPTEYRKGR